MLCFYTVLQLFQIEDTAMNPLIKPVFLSLFLTACEADRGYKVQVEPTLPVPVLIVPDGGSNSNPNNLPWRDDQSWQDQGSNNFEGGGGNNQQQYENDSYRDYRY